MRESLHSESPVPELRVRVRKPPAFQFYAKDWLSSMTVRAMEWAAKGLYIELLAYDWDNEGLPPDPEHIRRIVNMTEREWARCWPVIEHRFPVVQGRRRNPKLQEIRGEMQKLSSLRSAAVRGRPRQGFVYAALKRDTQIIKIGISDDPERRIRSLKTELPPGFPASKDGMPNDEEAVLIAAKMADNSLEQRAHIDLKDHHLGHEWFRASHATLAWIKKHLDRPAKFCRDFDTTNDEQNEGLHLQSASTTASAITNSEASPRRRETWVTKAGEAWHAAFGGRVPYAKIGAHLKPVVVEHGEEAVQAAWVHYLSLTAAQFASPARFSETFGSWVKGDAHRAAEAPVTEDEARSAFRVAGLPIPLRFPEGGFANRTALDRAIASARA